MCKLLAHPIPKGGVGFLDSREGFDKGRGIQGGLRPPSELCFRTSEIECCASWS